MNLCALEVRREGLWVRARAFYSLPTACLQQGFRRVKERSVCVRVRARGVYSLTTALSNPHNALEIVIWSSNTFFSCIISHSVPHVNCINCILSSTDKIFGGDVMLSFLGSNTCFLGSNTCFLLHSWPFHILSFPSFLYMSTVHRNLDSTVNIFGYDVTLPFHGSNTCFSALFLTFLHPFLIYFSRMSTINHILSSTVNIFADDVTLPFHGSNTCFSVLFLAFLHPYLYLLLSYVNCLS